MHTGTGELFSLFGKDIMLMRQETWRIVGVGGRKRQVGYRSRFKSYSRVHPTQKPQTSSERGKTIGSSEESKKLVEHEEPMEQGSR